MAKRTRRPSSTIFKPGACACATATQNGTMRFMHTLNNTVIASPRILIPLLEINQRADGSVAIPAVLQPYMGGIQEIVPH